MKRLPVGRKFFAIVDDEDFEKLKLYEYRWNASKSPIKYTNRYYALTGRGILLHRLIMNPPRGMIVDHINGDGLDNRRENLRICTRSQNAANAFYRHKRKSRIKKVKYKGVYPRAENGNFRVIVTINRKQIYLGEYKSAEEAALVYNAGAKKYFGEFAKLNEL